jgi:hypothetical protein
MDGDGKVQTMIEVFSIQMTAPGRLSKAAVSFPSTPILAPPTTSALKLLKTKLAEGTLWTDIFSLKYFDLDRKVTIWGHFLSEIL